MCGHQVPCTCPEYLDKLSEGELRNLRLEFAKIYPHMNWFERRYRRKEAALVNAALKQRFGYHIA